LSVQFGFNNLKYNNISHSENKNHKNVGFQGLNRYLSKQFIESEEIAFDALKKYPKSRRFVGNLPSEWIAKIPKANRRETVQQIQDLFAGFSEKLYSPKSAKIQEDEKLVADFSNQLKQILKLYTNIEYIDSGSAGKAYKLEVGLREYVFKVFHNDIGDIFTGSSGKLIEPARAPHSNKKGCKSFVDFYFGKIATEESQDGFMLTKFVEQDEKFKPYEEIKRLLNFLKSPVSSSDSYISDGRDIPDGLNIIGLKTIDFGELERVPKELNKKLKKFTKYFGNFYFNTKKNSDNTKAAFDQIKYTKKDFDHFSIDDDVKENFINVLQRLKKFTKELT